MDIQHHEKGKEFEIVSLDESFFFYDSLVRRVWITREKRPVVRIISSHETLLFVWSRKYDGPKAAIPTVC